jgi:hypothetical protein
MRKNNEVLEAMEKFKNLVEIEIGFKLKALKINRGGEHLFQAFSFFLQQISYFSIINPIKNPMQQNCITRKTQHYLTMLKVLYMMFLISYLTKIINVTFYLYPIGL